MFNIWPRGYTLNLNFDSRNNRSKIRHTLGVKLNPESSFFVGIFCFHNWLLQLGSYNIIIPELGTFLAEFQSNFRWNSARNRRFPQNHATPSWYLCVPQDITPHQVLLKSSLHQCSIISRIARNTWCSC